LDYDLLWDEDPFPYSDNLHQDFLAQFDDEEVRRALLALPEAYRVPLVSYRDRMPMGAEPEVVMFNARVVTEGAAARPGSWSCRSAVAMSESSGEHRRHPVFELERTTSPENVGTLARGAGTREPYGRRPISWVVRRPG
jgi:hypothetical protein